MTRPKVPDDKRQRTAQACESCKRRKQKCNGLKPCNTCTKRSLICEYDTRVEPQPGSESAGSPPKRARHVSPVALGQPGVPQDIPEPNIKSKRSSIDVGTPVPVPTPSTQPNSVTSIKAEPRRATFGPTPQHRRVISDHDLETISRRSTTSGGDEEAEVYTETRMLQDPTGRLLYLGDSATLSYLQFIRMVVESLNGPSPFTQDPNRHRLMEATVSLPTHIKPSTILPDRQTANVLVESYFTNTSGLIEIFNKNSFISQMDSCYLDPLSADTTFLCLLNLTFAIGLVLATPMPGSPEDQVIRRLSSGDIDRAELFYRSAKSLGDPVSGFEDADFWSVQALLLMAVYMLSRTKRNAAYAYYGMAVRSAFALGLHRHETMVIFNMAERALRRNVWRSLYVLDRFLAASLGRPTAISEEDCSPDVLRPPDTYGGPDADTAQSGALDAAVRSCQFIGIMLKKIYAKRKISTKLAQDIFDQHKEGPQKEHPTLYWRQAAANKLVSTAHGIAILHVNLLYCHAVILLTRPFFLYSINRSWRERTGVARQSPRIGSRMEKFSEACVKASYQTIALVQMGFESRYLPQRNPFIIHFLFAAALVILSNEFASLHKYPTYSIHISQAVSIMRYCAESDPQASRLIYILTTFRDVVSKVAPQPLDERIESMTRPSTAAASILESAGGFFLDQPSRSSTLQSHRTQTSRENSLTSADPAATRSYTSATVSPTTTTAVPQSFPGVVHPQDRDEPAAEAEFEFETLWQGWSMQASTHGQTGLGVSVSHQVPPLVPSQSHGHRGSYGGYPVPPAPNSQPGDGLNASVPLYPLSFH